MLATVAAVAVLILALELWVPLAFLFGAIKLVATLSLSAAWGATKSVPIWIWDFIHASLS
jgi:hypothetical protein